MPNFMRRLAAAALSLSLITSACAQADEPVPPHVQLARDFVEKTAPQDNHFAYLYKGPGSLYTRTPQDWFSSKYVVNTDCKGFQSDVLRRSYGFTPEFSTKHFGVVHSITDWVEGIERGETFQQVMRIQDVKLGDFALWSHPEMPGGYRGHIVLINKPPRKLATSRVPDLEQWEVEVIDSTGHAHSVDDTRFVKPKPGTAQTDAVYGESKERPTGVGRGRMHLYVNAEGAVRAVSNGFKTAKIFTDWHAIFARVPEAVLSAKR